MSLKEEIIGVMSDDEQLEELKWIRSRLGWIIFWLIIIALRF